MFYLSYDLERSWALQQYSIDQASPAASNGADFGHIEGGLGAQKPSYAISDINHQYNK